MEADDGVQSRCLLLCCGLLLVENCLPLRPEADDGVLGCCLLLCCGVVIPVVVRAVGGGEASPRAAAPLAPRLMFEVAFLRLFWLPPLPLPPGDSVTARPERPLIVPFVFLELSFPFLFFSAPADAVGWVDEDELFLVLEGDASGSGEDGIERAALALAKFIGCPLGLFGGFLNIYRRVWASLNDNACGRVYFVIGVWLKSVCRLATRKKRRNSWEIHELH